MKTKNNSRYLNSFILLISILILLICISINYFYVNKHRYKLTYKWAFTSYCSLFDSSTSIIMLNNFKDEFNQRHKVKFKWNYRNLNGDKLFITFYPSEDFDSPIVNTFIVEFDSYVKYIQSLIKDNDASCILTSLPLQKMSKID